MSIGYTLLITFISALGVAIMIAWVNSPSPRQARSREIAYGFGMMTFLGIFSLAFLALGIGMVLNVIPGRGTQNIWTQATFLGLGTLGLYSFLDGLTRRLVWDTDGVVVRKYLSRPHARPWADVVSVHYHALGQYYRLGFSDGTGFGFSETMRGANAFLNVAQDRGLLPTIPVDPDA